MAICMHTTYEGDHTRTASITPAKLTGRNTAQLLEFEQHRDIWRKFVVEWSDLQLPD